MDGMKRKLCVVPLIVMFSTHRGSQIITITLSYWSQKTPVTTERMMSWSRWFRFTSGLQVVSTEVNLKSRPILNLRPVFKTHVMNVRHVVWSLFGDDVWSQRCRPASFSSCPLSFYFSSSVWWETWSTLRFLNPQFNASNPPSMHHSVFGYPPDHLSVTQICCDQVRPPFLPSSNQPAVISEVTNPVAGWCVPSPWLHSAKLLCWEPVDLVDLKPSTPPWQEGELAQFESSLLWELFWTRGVQLDLWPSGRRRKPI